MPLISDTGVSLRAYDANGQPVSGARIAAYYYGTTLSAPLYADESFTVLHSEAANAAGVFPPVFMEIGVYKFDVTDPDTGASLPGFPMDNTPVGFSEEHEVANIEAAAARAEISAAMASGSEVTATAAAAAASEAIGAEIYADKAEADAALAGLSDGDFVQVLADESRDGQRSLYEVASGAYIYIRELGDFTKEGFVADSGRAGLAINTLAHAVKLHGMGSRGWGGADWASQAITASQSGTTVTASSAVFYEEHTDQMVLWGDGTFAIIRSVENSDANTATATVTVDRSQTVASASATLQPKHVVGVAYGDSLAGRGSSVLQSVLYRSFGFGGYTFAPNNSEQNDGSQIARVTVSGGASDVGDIADAGEYPWGQRYIVPSGGSLLWEFTPKYNLAGVERSRRVGLEPDEMKTDTAVLVWRRGAGAFTVERKRVWDTSWAAVATVADASTGTATYNHAIYQHGLGHCWQYRVTGTSGTVNFLPFQMLNNSAPGYVHWPCGRGGELISDFADLPQADLAELCKIYGQPSFRTIIAADEEGGMDTAAYRATIEADRSLWAGATATRCDHIWVATPDGTGADVDWNTALVQVALANNDGLVALDRLFGDFAQSEALGLLEDNIHMSQTGELLFGREFMRATGLDGISTSKEARDVNAHTGDFARLSVLGQDVGEQIRAVRNGPPSERGARWNFGDNGYLVSDVGAAIGTGDLTIQWDLDVFDHSFLCYLARIGTAFNSIKQNGGIDVSYQGGVVGVELTDASGNTIKYNVAVLGTSDFTGRRVLTLRIDAAAGEATLFIDGRQTDAWNNTSISGNTTSPLGTWVGTGTEFSLSQGAVDGRDTTIYGVGLWRSALSDAEILATVQADEYRETVPDFWWRMAEGMGRITRDFSGNNRHGIWQGVNPNQHNIDIPAWKFPRGGALSLPWEATVSPVTQLMPGDDIVAAYTTNEDLLLPDSASLGDVIRIAVNSANTIRITQNSGQQIKSGGSATTTGTGGSVTVPDATGVSLQCVAGGASTTWMISGHTGAALTFA